MTIWRRVLTRTNAFFGRNSRTTFPPIRAPIKSAPPMKLPTIDQRPSDFGPTHVASAEELTIQFHALAARMDEIERWREHIAGENSDG